MAHKFKEIVHGRSGVKVQTFIGTGRKRWDDDVGKFYAKYSGRKFVASNYDDLKKEVVAAIKEAEALEWIDVIEIKAGGKRSKFYSVGAETVLNCKRYHIAKRITGDDWLELTWRGNPDSILAVSHSYTTFGPLPFTREEDGEVIHYLPYDDKTWEMLEWLSERIVKMGETVSDFLGDDRLRKWLITKSFDGDWLFQINTPPSEGE